MNAEGFIDGDEILRFHKMMSYGVTQEKLSAAVVDNEFGIDSFYNNVTKTLFLRNREWDLIKSVSR